MTQEMIGLLLDQEHPLTLGELSRACSMHADWVLELVEEGILEPLNPPEVSRLQFSGQNLHRALIVRRLQRDLGVNLSGAALALSKRSLPWASAAWSGAEFSLC